MKFCVKKMLSIISILMFSSCVKDYVSSSETFLINNTTSIIEIFPYSQGHTYPKDKVIIYPNQKISAHKENVRGRTLNPGYASGLQPFDSIIVVFDNQYQTKHLSFRDSLLSCSKCVNFFDNRNLSNENSYKETITKEHKKYLRGYYEYTFTNADYNFAKD